MNTISVSQLCKSYAGKPAVRDLSFTLGSGEILGIIGPNGAGKSTTIKTILDFIKPDSGEVEVLGGPMCETAKDRIGYLPEEKGLYAKLTVIETIVYLATLKGMRPQLARERASQLLKRTGMLDHQSKKIKQLSKGMSQMIQFIVTIIHEPELLILDEPFSGLDPVNTELMKNMIVELRGDGRAIMLSTHQMNQIEELCDRVLMIDSGTSVLYGDLVETKRRFRTNTVQVAVEGELEGLEGVIATRSNRTHLELDLAPCTSTQNVLDQIRARNLTVNRFEIATPTLHEIFLDMVGEKN